MGTHKALLRFTENENFLQHIINVYKQAGIKKIIVVKNHNIEIKKDGIIYDPAHIIENNDPEKGRLYSIQLGVAAVQDAQYCYLQNIDNPCVTKELIEELYNSRLQGEYITPVFGNKGGHPILISAAIIKTIQQLSSHTATLYELLQMFNRYKLNTSDKNCLLNINLLSDYDNIFLRSTKHSMV